MVNLAVCLAQFSSLKEPHSSIGAAKMIPQQRTNCPLSYNIVKSRTRCVILSVTKSYTYVIRNRREGQKGGGEIVRITKLTPVKTAIDFSKLRKHRREHCLSVPGGVCLLPENIIVSQLMQHPERNVILSDQQHGFRENCSCEPSCLNSWTR